LEELAVAGAFASQHLNFSAFAFHVENDTEARFAAYHPLVSLGDPLQ
jgi:hypothetical protein